MRTIPIDSVIIPPDRQRQDFDSAALSELADSIFEIGLLQAPVFENDGRTLRAGERRYRAISYLASCGRQFMHDGELVQPGHLPYTLLSDLAPHQLFKVELEENRRRVNLSWQEEARAVARLEELYRTAALEAGDAPTIAGFAREVFGDATLPEARTLRKNAPEDLKIAQHLDDPDVANAKTRKEALNIVKRKQSELIEQELARQIAEKGFASEVVSPHTLYLGSAFDIAPGLPDGHFDLILTDPPYGIDMDRMSTQSGSSSGHTHNYSDDFAFAARCVELVATEGFRITRASAACFMFCDLRFFPQWSKVFEEAGWYVWPNPLIWNKSPTGSLLGEANGPRHVYETVLYAIKGRRGVNMVGADVISIPGPAANKLHPAEKPVDLYALLLAWTAIAGDRVVDFFCGCGPIFPAATRYQLLATGIEQNPAHHAKALLRKDSMSELL